MRGGNSHTSLVWEIRQGFLRIGNRADLGICITLPPSLNRAYLMEKLEIHTFLREGMRLGYKKTSKG